MVWGGLLFVLLILGTTASSKTSDRNPAWPGEVRPGEIALLDLALGDVDMAPRIQPVMIHGSTRRALRGGIASVLRIPAAVPPDASLVVAFGVTGPPSGMPDVTFNFTITAEVDGKVLPLLDAPDRPTSPSHQGWQERSIPVGSLAGKNVTFTFSTLKRPIPSGSVADTSLRTPMWGNPVLRYPTPTRNDPRPDVVLIIIDTLRADHLGSYGYVRRLSPHLDRLAAQGAQFDRAWAQSSWTTPSMVALMTGRYPDIPLQGRPARNWLDPSVPTLATLLRQAGYRCEGYVNNPNVDVSLGFSEGFDRYTLYTSDNALAEAVTSRLANPPPGPRFTYVHFLGPHVPYELARPFSDRLGFPAAIEGKEEWYREEVMRDAATEEGRARVIAAYDSLIAQTDARLAPILDVLRDRGAPDNTVVAVTSDHGEEFWEHGGWEHGHSLHAELLHVPLLIRHPPTFAPGTRVARDVEQFNLMPTLLQIVGQDPGPLVQARSLLKKGPPQAGEECQLAGNLLYGDQVISLACPDGKVIYQPQSGVMQFYQPLTDPKETLDRMGTLPDPQILRASWTKRIVDRLRRTARFQLLMNLDMPGGTPSVVKVKGTRPFQLISVRPPLPKGAVLRRDEGRTWEIRSGALPAQVILRGASPNESMDVSVSSASWRGEIPGAALGREGSPVENPKKFSVIPIEALAPFRPRPDVGARGAVRVWFQDERDLPRMASFSTENPDRPPSQVEGE